MRLALLGAWHVHAVDHLRWARRHPGAEVLCLWDDDPVRGRAFAMAHDLAFEPSLPAVLARADVDGVMVDCPTADHPEVIGAALAAGKHVFTEKVLALTASDADALAQQARAAGLVLWVSLQRLGEARLRTIRDLVAGGAIGQVMSSRIRYSHGGARGNPPIPAHFFDPDAAGGGAMIDLGAHPAYLSMSLHGAAPVSVTALASQVTGLGVDDNSAYLMRFAGGALGVAEVSFVADRFSYAVEVTGTDGMILCGPADMRVLLRRAGEEGWSEQPLAPEADDMLARFVEAVADGGTAEADELLTLSQEVTRVLSRAYAAAG